MILKPYGVLKINTLTIHGTALEIFDCGVIIIGNSAIGKSEVALSLIDRGHKLIADDAVNINLNPLSIESTSTFIHIRGLGFLNIEKIFPKQSKKNKTSLDLIIELVTTDLPHNQLTQLIATHDILNHKIPKVTLPIGNNRPLALLVETIVKYMKEKQIGYDSHQIFLNERLNLLKGE